MAAASELPDSRPPVAVIGAGLCGGLAALALARRGFAVCQLAPPSPADDQAPVAAAAATALSYGALAGPASWQAWTDLERLHGPLGLRPATLLQHGGWSDRLPAALRAWPSRLWGLGRVDTPTLLAALPAALDAAGVHQLIALVQGLERLDGGWQLSLATPFGEERLQCPRVVLAAGAGCRALWPALPDRLRQSWAGVLLPDGPLPGRWGHHAARGRVLQPLRWQRPLLEAAAAGLEREAWIVDAGFAPRDGAPVLGQISLVRPGPEAGPPPDPAWMEERLRQGLTQLDPALGTLAARYRQAPVSFCLGGAPLVGPVPGAPGLWAFAGFSGAFSLVPRQAERLADALAAGPGGVVAGRR